MQENADSTKIEQEGDTVKIVALTGLPKQGPGCSENFTFLREAIDYCAQHCAPAGISGFLPTRLIDVGTEAESGTARLVIT